MADEPREADHEPDAGGSDDEVAAAVVAKFPSSVAVMSHGQSVVYVDRAECTAVAEFLRAEQQFTMCVDSCAVDHLTDGVRYCPDGVRPERFEVVVNLLSHVRNRRIRLIAQVPADDPTIPSLVPSFPGANFSERETFDLFGISFDGHPDLVRILMPDEWEGHPLRKDYPSARVPVTFKGDPSPR